MNDILPGEIETWQRTEETIRSLLHTYAYSEIRTPLLEDTELFSRSIGENTDVVQKEMFTFSDQGGNSLSLRPEGTAPVIRSYIENHLHHGSELLKLYYIGPMFRHERPQKGRLRQFHSVGAEAIGSHHPLVDVEIIAIVWDILNFFELEEIRLDINSVGDETCRPAYRKALKEFLIRHRSDLSETAKNRIEENPLRVLDSKVEADQSILKNAPEIRSFLSKECENHIESVQKGLRDIGIPFTYNPRIVRGLDYYTHTAFEFSAAGLGSQNAVAGGGRYNSLSKLLSGPDVPAVGFGLGLERLLLASKKSFQAKRTPSVVLIPLGKGSESVAFNTLTEIRRKLSWTADIFLDSGSLKSAMRKANKRNFRFAVIIGDRELQEGIVVLKDLVDKDQSEVPLRKLTTKLLESSHESEL